MDYGPSLPPRLRDNQSRHDPNASDQSSGPSDGPSRVASARQKKHTDKRHDTDLIHTSDQHSGLSNEPTRVASGRPQKYADERKHQDQSSIHRHSSSKPSKAHSDQDQPQHDPDPPFYREVSLADISSQYAEEVDTLRVFQGDHA